MVQTAPTRKSKSKHKIVLLAQIQFTKPKILVKLQNRKNVTHQTRSFAESGKMVL